MTLFFYFRQNAYGLPYTIEHEIFGYMLKILKFFFINGISNGIARKLQLSDIEYIYIYYSK